MKFIDFTTIEECEDCYGRDNLIAIDNIKQIIFYTGHGCQPKFVCENEIKKGKLTCWFLKSETKFVYRKWMHNSKEGDCN